MKEGIQKPEKQMSIVDVLGALSKEDSVPRFRGHEAFWHITRLGRIVPGVTVVRVMYSGVIDTLYKVDERFRLIEVGDEGTNHDPTIALSYEDAPDGWEIDYLKPVRVT